MTSPKKTVQTVTKLIYHIATQEEWDRAQEVGEYRGDTLDGEGFIHCSTADQLDEVGEYLFKWVDDLVLLGIDEELVVNEIKYEDAGNGETYPHIYGPLNIDAILSVKDYFVE